MDKRISLFGLLLGTLLFAAACIREQPVPDRPATEIPDGFARYRLSIGGADPGTKSSLNVSTERITSAAVAVYRGGHLESVLRWDGSGNSSTLLLEKDVRYALYAVTGSLLTQQDFPAEEAALSEMHCTLWDPDTDEFLCQEGGFTYIPMAGTASGRPEDLDIIDGTQDGLIHLTLERLFAQVFFDKVRLSPEAARYYSVSGQEFSVCNNASVLFPFSQRPSPTVRPGTFDHEDCYAPAGIRYALTPENLQGNLLPRNDDPYQKTAESLQAVGRDPDAETYVRVRVSFHSDYGVSGQGIYRFYLGDDDTSDFSVRRNTCYRVSLYLTLDGMELKDNWKVEEISLQDNRSLQLFSEPEPVAPGGTVRIACRWSRRGSSFEDFSTDYGASQGWSFGTGDQVAVYVEDGSANSLSVTQEEAVRCPGCGTLFLGWPTAGSGRLRMIFLLRYCSGTINGEKHCLRCGALVSGANGTESDTAFKKATSEQIVSCGVIRYTVPADTEPWSVIPLYAQTFDGKVSDCLELQVASDSPNTYRWANGRPSYVAQKGVLTATTGTGITGVRFSVAPGSEEMLSVENTSDAHNNKSCTVSALAPGQARLAIRGYTSDGQEVSCGYYALTVSAPKLHFSASSYTLPLTGDFVPTGLYYSKNDGTVLSESDFDSALYASLLDPVLEMKEGSLLAPYVTLSSHGGTGASDPGVELHSLRANGRPLAPADFSDESSVLQALPLASSLRDRIVAEVPLGLADPFPALNANVMLGAVDNVILLQDGPSTQPLPHARPGSCLPGEKILFRAPLNPAYRIEDIAFEGGGDLRFAVHPELNGYGLTPVLGSASGTLSAGRKELYLDLVHKTTGEHYTLKSIGYVDIYLHAFLGASLQESYANTYHGIRPRSPGTLYTDFTLSTATEYPTPDYEVSYDLVTGNNAGLEALKARLSGAKFLLHKKRWTDNWRYCSEKDLPYMEKEIPARYTDGKEYVPRNIFSIAPYGYLDSMIIVGPTHHSYDGGYAIRNNSIEYSTDNTTLLNIQNWSCDYERVFTTHGLVRAFGEPVYAIRFGHWRQEHMWPGYAEYGNVWACFCKDYYPALRVDLSGLPSSLDVVDNPDEGTRTLSVPGAPYYVITVGKDNRYTWSKWITPRTEFKY